MDNNLKRNKLMNRALILFSVLFIAALGFFIFQRYMSDHSATGLKPVAAPKQLYRCPMHPQVVQDHPGDCPICGMRLVAFTPEEDRGDQLVAPTEPTPKKKIRFRSTMNASEISEQPGKDSMGMEMVPFEVEEPGRGDRPVAPTGLAPVKISAEARQRMGLTLGTVERRFLQKEVRTSARIVPDETRLYRVTTKVEGWVDQLYVNVTGQAVEKGQPLLAIYSPELVATEEELLAAIKMARNLSNSPFPNVSASGEELVAAARRRLKLMDLSDAEIRRIERTGEVRKNMTLSAPASGFVLEKNVLAGQKIMPGDSLMVIADLSQVWGLADIYEPDLPYIAVGMPAVITLPYRPGQTFAGTIVFLDPALNPQTRTLRARLDIPNPGLALKPEMFATARLFYNLGEELAVPEGAVMRTGEHAFAFVAGEGEQLIPKEITVGARSDGYFQVLSGLNEGDRVVTSANFLVDSESSLKAALQALTRE